MSHLYTTTEEENLNRLKQQIQSCQKCKDIGLLTDRKILGEGPLNSSTMSVAEAPGESEYQTGRVFQGRAGNYWEGMLGAVGVERSQIYACNTICCRPMWQGQNNKISPDYQEVHACQPFLFRQLEIIKPRLILVFGKTAAYSLGLLRKSDPLGSVLGERFYEYACSDGIKRNAQMVVTYHPSYLMRGGKEKDNWLSYKHLCRAKEILNGMVSG